MLYLNIKVGNVIRWVVFDGVLHASPGCRDYLNIGTILNILTLDLSQIQMAVNVSHALLNTPFVVLLYTFILILRVGWIGLSMPLFIALIYVSNRCMNNLVLRRKWEKD